MSRATDTGSGGAPGGGSEGGPAVYTIPPGMPFADALAAGMLARTSGDPLALAGALVLLPTRRAGRALRDAFLRQSAGRALLLKALDGDEWIASIIHRVEPQALRDPGEGADPYHAHEPPPKIEEPEGAGEGLR